MTDWKKSKLPASNDLFDTKSNPFLTNSVIKQFIAVANGKTVGRIAAIVDQDFIDSQGEAVGQFGFFDCIDKQLVASALFNTASQWLREREMVKIMGPSYPSPQIHDGLLIAGFENDPYDNAPWNPNYYHQLFESSGFEKIQDYHTWHHNDIAQVDSDISLSHIDSSYIFKSYSNYKNNSRIQDHIWNTLSTINFARDNDKKLSSDEVNYLNKLYRNILAPRQVTIAELSNKPVGIAIIIPELYFSLLKSKRYVPPVRQIVFEWSKRKHLKGRLAFFMIDKINNNFELKNALFRAAQIEAMRNKLEITEVANINDDDVELQQLLIEANYSKYKTFRIFNRPLRQ